MTASGRVLEEADIQIPRAFHRLPYGPWRMSRGAAAREDGPPAPDPARLSAVQRGLMMAFTGQVPAAAAANAVVAMGTVVVVWPSVSALYSLPWLALMAATSLARVWLARLAAKAGARAGDSESGTASMARHRAGMTVVAGINGLLWSVLGGILVPPWDTEPRAFTSCVLVAVAATAVASHVALPAAGRVFAAAVLVPWCASYALYPVSTINIALAVLGMVYLALLLNLLHRTGAVLEGAIAEQLRNGELHAEVETTCARLAQAVETAREANRSKSRFLASMSHEIRTPMNAVLGLSAALLDEPLPPGHRESVGTIHDSAGTLLRIINEVLDFSQIEAGRVTLEEAPFSPRDLVRETVTVVGPRAAAKGLAIRTEWDPALPEGLRGDAGRIRQILLNLAGNAVKFTGRGEVVIGVLRIGPEADGAPMTSKPGENKPGENKPGENEPERDVTVEWRVHDSGIGISPTALRTLFQDFAQADESISRRFGGSGLGLAISRRLVELMGGTIAACSVPGEGSVFSFRLSLPAAPPPPAAAGADGDACGETLRAILAASGRAVRVLVAEDNPTNQFVIRQLLKQFAIAVDIAADGHAAVEAADRTAYDLIYMDMRMPGMDGVEAAREIRRREGAGRRAPIVACTANAFEADIQACRAAGMDDFIAKPIGKADFIAMTARMLRQSEAVTALA